MNVHYWLMITNIAFQSEKKSPFFTNRNNVDCMGAARLPFFYPFFGKKKPVNYRQICNFIKLKN